MNALEQTVDLDDAREGMQLARELRDAGGGVLLPAGASLSASSLNSLRRRGIEQIVVVAEAPAEDPAIAAARRARAGKRLDHLFRHSATLGASAALLERLRTYRKES